MVKFRTARSVWIVAIAVAVFAAQSIPVCASRCTAAGSAPRDLAAMAASCAPGPAISCPTAAAAPALDRSAAPDETAAVRLPAALAPPLDASDGSLSLHLASRLHSLDRQVSLPLLI